MMPGGDDSLALPRLLKREELPLGSRVLRLGCRGRDVLTLQRELAAAGFVIQADGEYGLITEAAVERFQSRWHLKPDGRAGPATLARLNQLRIGRGVRLHRARAGESIDKAALALGVRVDILRRFNHLPRGGIVRGALLSAPARLLLARHGQKLPSRVRVTGWLGPRFGLAAVGSRPEADGSACLPIFSPDGPDWPVLLRHPKLWPAAAERIGAVCAELGWPRWSVDLPPRIWRWPRRTMRCLNYLQRRVGLELWPLVRWPGRSEPLPPVRRLNRISRCLLFDPGSVVFDYKLTGLLLRQILAIMAPERLVLALAAGGLAQSANGTAELKPVRAARADAIAGRARLTWHEEMRVYLAEPREDNLGRLLILEERGLWERARLAERLDLGGLAFLDLSGVAFPPWAAWPGIFSPLDSFPQDQHID